MPPLTNEQKQVIDTQRQHQAGTNKDTRFSNTQNRTDFGYDNEAKDRGNISKPQSKVADITPALDTDDSILDSIPATDFVSIKWGNTQYDDGTYDAIVTGKVTGKTYYFKTHPNNWNNALSLANSATVGIHIGDIGQIERSEAKKMPEEQKHNFTLRLANLKQQSEQIMSPASGGNTWNEGFNEVGKPAGETLMSESNKHGTTWVNNATSEENLNAMDPFHKSSFHDQWRDDGNLNGMSFAATRNLSRAADRLNNKQWWTTKGLMTTDSNGNVNTSAEWGAYRKQPIETQEMRQMRMHEGLERQLISGDIARAQNVLNYNVEARKKRDELEYNTLAEYLKSNQQFASQIQNAMVQIKMIQPGSYQMQELYQQFMRAVGINEKQYWLENALNIAENEGPVQGLMVLAIAGAAMQLDTKSWYLSRYMSDRLRKGDDFMESLASYLQLEMDASKAQNDIAEDTASGNNPTPTSKDGYTSKHDRGD